jgi:hypothetical protein
MKLPGELRAALEALAGSGTAQPSLFPTLSPTPDALAADFDHWWRIVREEHFALTKAERRALGEVTEQLAAMTTGVDHRNWTEEAMRSSPAWERLRQLARVALSTLGWVGGDADPPGSDSDADVKGGA